ncbi:MAG: hypothetical protein ACI8QS_000605 [Planctomycetota bacterium]|jgi:hypothetical protein
MRDSLRPQHSFHFATGTLAALFLFGVPAGAQLASTETGGIPAERSSGTSLESAVDEVALPDGQWTCDWLSQARESLRQGEYHLSPLGSNTWSAPNRSQGLRIRIDQNGLETFRRETAADGLSAEWRLRLGTASLGRVGALSPLTPGQVLVEDGRAELDYGLLTEWFLSDERGIEQGWTIDHRPEGDGMLAIGLLVEGDLTLRLNADGQAGVFLDAAGEEQLLYRKLMAWDATGKELAVRMVDGAEGPEVHLDDTQATYPITVDPLLSSEDWSAESDQVGALFGFSVNGAGDVNGDGFDDVIVGAPFYDVAMSDRGAAFVFYGSATGLSTAADWEFVSSVSSKFGESVAGAGDVNGDGYDDVIVGAGAHLSMGAAYCFHGSATGLSDTATWLVLGSVQNGAFGASVSGAGDVNCDGFDDVIVGAYLSEVDTSNEGLAFVYHGSATGLNLSPSWAGEGDQLNAFFGGSVASAGDVNGDGFADIIVGAEFYSNDVTQDGRAFVYHGSADGIGETAAWTAEPDQLLARFGSSVSGAGDVNGDGYADVIVGSRLFDDGETDEGRAFVYHGSAAGLSTEEAWTAESNQPFASLGETVSGAGDVNGDGYSDVIVGARLFNGAGPDTGRVYVFHGSSAGLEAAAAMTVESSQTSAFFGGDVAAAGDVNGDGFADVIVGATGHSNGESNEGGAFLFHGNAAPLADGYVHNGSGLNPICLSSEPPVIGESWSSAIDTSVRPVATFSLLVVLGQPSSDCFLPGGELLVDLSSTVFVNTTATAGGSPTAYTVRIPNVPAIAGITGTAQGVAFGGGYTLCNGYTFTVGF